MANERDLNIMDRIQRQKEADIAKAGLLPLDAEGQKLASGKRFTFDIVQIPTDPLR